MRYPSQYHAKSERYFKHVLHTLGWTATMFARKAHLSRQSVLNYSHGKVWPSPQCIQFLDRKLNVPSSELLRNFGIPSGRTHFGKCLRALRYHRGMTERQLLNRLGLLKHNSGRAGKLERSRRVPSDKSVFRISDAMHVNPAFFANAIYLDKTGADAIKPGIHLLRRRYFLKQSRGDFQHAHDLGSDYCYCAELDLTQPTEREAVRIALVYQLPAKRVLKWYGYDPAYADTTGFMLLASILLAHLKISKAGELLNVSRQMVYQYITNQFAMPTLRQIGWREYLLKHYPNVMKELNHVAYV